MKLSHCLAGLFIWLFIMLLGVVFAGHEVLAGIRLQASDIQPHEIAIIQYDNRPLQGYLNASVRWNNAYAYHYGHSYLYINSSSPCVYGQLALHEAWCKVQAMLSADSYQDWPQIKVIVYLDSDVVITVNSSLAIVIKFMTQSLNWNIIERPLAINQDGPGWSCKHALKLGMPICFNSGTVLWYKSHLATDMLQRWWHSVSEPYDKSFFPTKWRTRWPWEQAQLYRIFHEYRSHIMVLSFPNMTYLPWTSSKNPKSQYPTDSIEPWCWSHWPGANCFITHHCASPNQKKKIIEWYGNRIQTNDLLTIKSLKLESSHTG